MRVIEHSLNVDPKVQPSKQNLRKVFKNRIEGAKHEVKNLFVSWSYSWNQLP